MTGAHLEITAQLTLVESERLVVYSTALLAS
jgi:hypothetical protein